MEVLQKKVEVGGTLVLDDKFLVDCHYTGTILLYSGGEMSSTPGTRFENCPVQFSGAAARTVALLASIGALKSGFGTAAPPTQPMGKPQ